MATHFRSVVRNRVSTGMALWPVRVTGDAGLGGNGCAKASSEGLEVMYDAVANTGPRFCREGRKGGTKERDEREGKAVRCGSGNMVGWVTVTIE